MPPLLRTPRPCALRAAPLLTPLALLGALGLQEFGGSARAEPSPGGIEADYERARREVRGGDRSAVPPAGPSAPVDGAKRPHLDGGEPLPNFHTVSPGIYRSGQPSREGFKILAGMGVKTDLNLMLNSLAEEREVAEGVGMSYVKVGMNGIWSPSFGELDRALKVLGDPGRRPLLVHCKHGKDRTGVTVAAYRVVFESMDPALAAQEARTYGCCAPRFKPLEDYLRRYQRHRRRRERGAPASPGEPAPQAP